MASRSSSVNSTRRAPKIGPANGARQASTARGIADAKRSGRRQGWKKALERNLILVGYSPAEAKELVALAAA